MYVNSIKVRRSDRMMSTVRTYRLGHVPISVTMLGRPAVEAHRVNMVSSPVALVLLQTVPGVALREIAHVAVTSNFRQDACGRDTPGRPSPHR